MSEMSPWEREQLVQSLEAFCKEANVRAAKRRWLVTLRTADGAERHLSITGNPPRELVLPCQRPMTIDFTPKAVPVYVPMLTRTYVLHDISDLDGTAVYREDIR